MLTSTSNRQVKNVMALAKKTKARKEQGLFLVEGMKMFREMPRGWLEKAYVSETFAAGTLMEEVCAVCTPEVVENRVFEHMSGTCSPQGILALVRQPQKNLEEMYHGAGDSGPAFFLLLEAIQDPGNLGTILRTAEASGCSGVIMSRDTVDIYNPKVIRSTMGAVYRVPFFYVESLAEAARDLKQKGLKVYAAHLEGAVDFRNPDYRKPCACLVGNEGRGLTDELSGLADGRIKIPMAGQAESLNAAVSAALIMYEVQRQRSAGGFTLPR